MAHAWHAISAVVLGISFLTTFWLTWKLFAQKKTAAFVSTVHAVLCFFFLYLCLWSLLRMVFLVAILVVDPQENEQALKEIEDHGEYAGLRLRGLVSLSKIESWPLVTLLILGDTCLVGVTLWIFPMTRELFRLAKTSMDRGNKGERVIVQRYLVVVHLFILAFLCIQAAHAVQAGGYDQRESYVMIMGNVVQLLGLVYIAFALLILKCKGRNLEVVQGHFTCSPLYMRIKRIMLVFLVFSLQYELFSFLLLMPHAIESMPPSVVGLTSLWYRFMPIALSFVMGCSQECLVKSCARWLPKEYTENFYVDDLSHFQDMGNRLVLAPDPSRNDKVVFVFTDIQASTALWAIGDGQLMRDANELHDDIVRSLLAKYNGYEITTCGDAFQLAFHSIKDAVEYCIHVQLQLLHAKWPRNLHKCGLGAVHKERVRGRLLFNGLRVRMGIHDYLEQAEGKLVRTRHPITGRVTYTGLSEMIASALGDLGSGGQILLSSRVAQWVANNRKALGFGCEVQFVDRRLMPGLEEEIPVSQLVIQGLEARTCHFGPLATIPKESVAIEVDAVV